MWDNHKALKGLADVLLFASLLMILYAGVFWVTHAPVFPVKRIQITGHMKRVTPEQLRFIAEHELSGTFFTLDIDKTRAAFGKLPWVRDAQVRRRWPDTLDIEVDEHAALARWGENGLISVKGEWFDAASDENLPVLYGPAGSQKDMGQMLERLRHQLDVAGLVPARLWLSDRRAWRVELNNGIRLELGRGEVESRVTRFASYWKDTLGALPYHIEYVDMRYPNGFAVRMPDYRTPPASVKK